MNDGLSIEIKKQLNFLTSDSSPKSSKKSSSESKNIKNSSTNEDLVESNPASKKILKELGIEVSQETVKVVNDLIKKGVEPSKENIELILSIAEELPTSEDGVENTAITRDEAIELLSLISNAETASELIKQTNELPPEKLVQEIKAAIYDLPVRAVAREELLEKINNVTPVSEDAAVEEPQDSIPLANLHKDSSGKLSKAEFLHQISELNIIVENNIAEHIDENIENKFTDALVDTLDSTKQTIQQQFSDTVESAKRIEKIVLSIESNKQVPSELDSDNIFNVKILHALVDKAVQYFEQGVVALPIKDDLDLENTAVKDVSKELSNVKELPSKLKKILLPEDENRVLPEKLSEVKSLINIAKSDNINNSLELNELENYTDEVSKKVFNILSGKGIAPVKSFQDASAIVNQIAHKPIIKENEGSDDQKELVINLPAKSNSVETPKATIKEKRLPQENSRSNNQEKLFYIDVKAVVKNLLNEFIANTEEIVEAGYSGEIIEDNIERPELSKKISSHPKNISFDVHPHEVKQTKNIGNDEKIENENPPVENKILAKQAKIESSIDSTKNPVPVVGDKIVNSSQVTKINDGVTLPLKSEINNLIESAKEIFATFLGIEKTALEAIDVRGQEERLAPNEKGVEALKPLSDLNVPGTKEPNVQGRLIPVEKPIGQVEHQLKAFKEVEEVVFEANEQLNKKAPDVEKKSEEGSEPLVDNKNVVIDSEAIQFSKVEPEEKDSNQLIGADEKVTPNEIKSADVNQVKATILQNDLNPVFDQTVGFSTGEFVSNDFSKLGNNGFEVLLKEVDTFQKLLNGFNDKIKDQLSPEFLLNELAQLGNEGLSLEDVLAEFIQNNSSDLDNDDSIEFSKLINSFSPKRESLLAGFQNEAVGVVPEKPLLLPQKIEGLIAEIELFERNRFENDGQIQQLRRLHQLTKTLEQNLSIQHIADRVSTHRDQIQSLSFSLQPEVEIKSPNVSVAQEKFDREAGKVNSYSVNIEVELSSLGEVKGRLVSSETNKQIFLTFEDNDFKNLAETHKDELDLKLKEIPFQSQLFFLDRSPNDAVTPTALSRDNISPDGHLDSLA